MISTKIMKDYSTHRLMLEDNALTYLALLELFLCSSSNHGCAATTTKRDQDMEEMLHAQLGDQWVQKGPMSKWRLNV